MLFSTTVNVFAISFIFLSVVMICLSSIVDLCMMLFFIIAILLLKILILWHLICFDCCMTLEDYAQMVSEAEKFPLGSVLVCILVATVCIACLMVLAWFLFRTKLPRLDSMRRPVNGRDDRDV